MRSGPVAGFSVVLGTPYEPVLVGHLYRTGDALPGGQRPIRVDRLRRGESAPHGPAPAGEGVLFSIDPGGGWRPALRDPLAPCGAHLYHRRIGAVPGAGELRAAWLTAPRRDTSSVEGWPR